MLPLRWIIYAVLLFHSTRQIDSTTRKVFNSPRIRQFPERFLRGFGQEERHGFITSEWKSERQKSEANDRESASEVNISESKPNDTAQFSPLSIYDVPESYILDVDLNYNVNSLDQEKKTKFVKDLSDALELPEPSCYILTVIPLSAKKFRLEVYCENNLEKLHGVSLESKYLVPAKTIEKALKKPKMRPVIKLFNITSFAVKHSSDEADLAVYQEMWFPVAVVAGITAFLVILAIICLVFCRRKLDPRMEEERRRSKHLDPEKHGGFLFPSVDPMNTVSASMIQPDTGGIYRIAGSPPKAQKWKGSKLSLSDRRGSKVPLALDLRPSVNFGMGPIPKESPTEEKLYNKSNPLSLEGLEDAVDNLKQIYNEFWEIPMNHPLPQERLPGSSYRNRYPFVLPNPKTRVKLPDIPNDPLSSYINANFIKGYKNKPKVYIGTQGPMSCTVNDFWRMIWYHNCPIVVMITKLKEINETKCEQYWPDPRKKMQEKYGEIIVTYDSAVVRDGYTLTSLYISHSQQLEAPRRVSHYWYTAWPDHGVPESPKTLLELVKEVMEAQNYSQGPVVTHCSAGIGRTGCFIATSIGIQQIHAANSVDILKIVSLMRIERGGMVETEGQYEFLYRTLFYYWSNLKNQASVETAEEEKEDSKD